MNCFDLIEDKSDSKQDTYYLKAETSKMAQEVFENKQLSLLIDAIKDEEPKDLKIVHDMLLRFSD